VVFFGRCLCFLSFAVPFDQVESVEGYLWRQGRGLWKLGHAPFLMSYDDDDEAFIMSS